MKEHIDEIDKLDFVMESDYGTFTPLGLTFSGLNESFCIVQEVVQ